MNIDITKLEQNLLTELTERGIPPLYEISHNHMLQSVTCDKHIKILARHHENIRLHITGEIAIEFDNIGYEYFPFDSVIEINSKNYQVISIQEFDVDTTAFYN